jgi:hypothetical protein
MARLGNGSTDGLLIQGFGLAPPFSIGCWFRPEQDQISTLMAACTSSVVTGFFGLRFRGDQVGDPLEAIQQETSPGAAAAASQAGAVLGAWQHGLGVFASNSSRTVYLNGSGATNGTALGATTPDRLSLLYSARGATPSAYLGGAVAHAAVWSAALTAREAAALASGASPRSIRPGNLVAYWPLEGLNRREEIDLASARALAVNGTSWAPDPPAAAVPRPPHLAMAGEARAATWHDGPLIGSGANPPPRRPVKWYPGLSASRRRRRGS